MDEETCVFMDACMSRRQLLLPPSLPPSLPPLLTVSPRQTAGTSCHSPPSCSERRRKDQTNRAWDRLERRGSHPGRCLAGTASCKGGKEGGREGGRGGV